MGGVGVLVSVLSPAAVGELLGKFRRERIEAPTAGRVQRMVRSALRTADQAWTARICDRLGIPTRARLLALVASASGQDADEGTDEGDHDGSTEAIRRRFTRNASHPTYQAMLEVGRAQTHHLRSQVPARPAAAKRDHRRPERR